MQTPAVVLHVGMPQSGAGLIQRGLARSRAQLQARGISYLGQADLEALPHVAGWQRSADVDRAQVASFERELAQAAYSSPSGVPGRLGRSDRSVVLLSSDHLLGNAIVGAGDVPVFRPRAEVAITQALHSLQADRARIVLYVQRQDRLMELSYLRAIQAGASHSFAEHFPLRYDAAFDYRPLIDRLASIPRVSEVVVRPVELSLGDPTAFLDDFLAVVGLRGVLPLATLTASSPRHYSHQGLNLALALNPLLESDAERLRVRRFLLATFAAPGSRVLSDVERGKIVDAHRAVNRDLFRSSMPDLPADSYDNDERTSALAAVLPGYTGASVRRTIAAIRDVTTARSAISVVRRRLRRPR